MISLDKSGGRTIHLFIPFEYNKRRVESITLAPLRLGHVRRWTEGAWKSSVDLLVELSGENEMVINELRYPDADRVMECFMAMVTPEIRNDIAEGTIPLKRESFEEEAEQPPRVTNGSGAIEEPPPMMAPGVPLPEAGFDMSEEP